MAATAAQIAQLRRMVAEPTTDTYSDAALTTVIESFSLLDPLGLEPYTWDYSTTPPSQDANEEWIPTYDLHAAAAVIWEEKAGALTGNFDFAADGASFSRSQAYDMAMKQARRHSARRAPTTLTQIVEPRLSTETYLVNAPEPGD